MSTARLYKRGRIWWTWYYEHPSGKRRDVSTKCRDQRAATLVARGYERTAAEPHAAADPASLLSACERFGIDLQTKGRSEATLRFYDPKLGHLLRIIGDGTLLDDLTAKLVDDYIAQRLDEGASRHTVAKELGALGAVGKGARRRGDCRIVIGDLLPDGWSSGYKPRKTSHTLEQARALLGVLPAHRAAHAAFIYVSGARDGESARAKRADIDMTRGLIRVRGTKTESSPRTVPIPEYVADLAARAFLGASPGGQAYRPWCNIRRDLAAACKRAGVPKVTPNDMRRSASTWLVERGVPTGVVSFFLGHKTARMVEQVYGRLDGEQLARAFAHHGIKTAADLQRQAVASTP